MYWSGTKTRILYCIDVLVWDWDQNTLQHRLVSFPDLTLPKKRKEGLVFWATILVTWGGAVLRKECHNCIFISGTLVSDTSVHMDYYTARFAKARNGRKVYWDSWKQAARQVFTISDSFQNTIAYVHNVIMIKISDVSRVAVFMIWSTTNKLNLAS